MQAQEPLLLLPKLLLLGLMAMVWLHRPHCERAADERCACQTTWGV